MIELTCSECGHKTTVDEKLEKELIKKFDPKYPARSVVVECACKQMQFILTSKRKI